MIVGYFLLLICFGRRATNMDIQMVLWYCSPNITWGKTHVHSCNQLGISIDGDPTEYLSFTSSMGSRHYWNSTFYLLCHWHLISHSTNTLNMGSRGHPILGPLFAKKDLKSWLHSLCLIPEKQKMSIHTPSLSSCNGWALKFLRKPLLYQYSGKKKKLTFDAWVCIN
jgi:hypothetical protein